MTTSYYSNVNMATAATVTTSPTKLKTKEVVEDIVTVSIDDRCFSSAPDDVLTQSTHVSAEIELVRILVCAVMLYGNEVCLKMLT